MASCRYGAGPPSRNPPLRPAAPAATRPASTPTTDNPRAASSSIAARPDAPRPTTQASAVRLPGSGGRPGQSRSASQPTLNVEPPSRPKGRVVGPSTPAARDPGSLRKRRSRQRELALAEDGDPAVGDLVPSPVEIELDTDVRAFGHDDVLVEDRPADDGAPPDLDVVHDHRCFDVGAGVHADVGRDDAVAHGRPRDDGARADDRLLGD